MQHSLVLAATHHVYKFSGSAPTNFNNITVHGYNYYHVYFIPQFTHSNTEEDTDAYIELGNVSSVDLISFAYQIASGMVG